MKNQPNEFSYLTLVAIDAALAAGDLLRKGFGSRFSIEEKPGRMNLVTEYDKRSEKSIIQFIKMNVPSSHFLAEEGGVQGDQNTEILWIIDPLDGTVNFAKGIPFFSVSIAAQKMGKTICGVVLNPLTNELFVAETGRGAFLNGQRIHVSKTLSIDQAILATGFPYNLSENPSHCIERFSDILKAGIPVRRLGSAALDLAYTAAGRFDGFFEPCLKPWDIAAGNLLVEEAGGKISTWNNQPFDIQSGMPLLATNNSIHRELSKLLSKQ
jgi:myo-inositol-1(or 4)-monophosphatase